MKSVVLQVDFSENATIASQCEVQSAHWNHGQATFFKAHAWIKRDTSEGQSMVIVSNDLNHTKYSIYVFMQQIFSHLKTTYPDIEHINIFSDGPTCTANNFLDAKWESIRALPRTHHIHCVKSHGSDKVKVSDTTDDTDVRNVRYE